MKSIFRSRSPERGTLGDSQRRSSLLQGSSSNCVVLNIPQFVSGLQARWRPGSDEVRIKGLAVAMKSVPSAVADGFRHRQSAIAAPIRYRGRY